MLNKKRGITLISLAVTIIVACTFVGALILSDEDLEKNKETSLTTNIEENKEIENIEKDIEQQERNSLFEFNENMYEVIEVVDGDTIKIEKDR